MSNYDPRKQLDSEPGEDLEEMAAPFFTLLGVVALMVIALVWWWP